MKKIYIIVVTIMLVCSMALNIFLIFKQSGIEINSNVLGVYQAQYYNKSMTITLKIYEGGICRFGNYATEYSNLENDCTWEKNNNILIIRLDERQVYNAEILSNGNLLLNNHKLEKIG